MSTTSDPFDFDHRIEAPPEQSPIKLVSDYVEQPGRPDQIVVSPFETDSEVVTEWIIANATDVVDLEHRR